jgi:hypothetical protein
MLMFFAAVGFSNKQLIASWDPRIREDDVPYYEIIALGNGIIYLTINAKCNLAENGIPKIYHKI